MPVKSQIKKDEKELILQYLIQTSNEALYWNQLANERSFEMSKQLLGTGILTIPLIGTFIATGHSFFNGTVYYIIFTFFNIFISIIFGLIHLYVGGEFFNTYSLFNNNRAGSLYKTLLDDDDWGLSQALIKAKNANYDKPSAKGNKIFFILQTIFLGIGLLTISGVIVSTIFSNY